MKIGGNEQLEEGLRLHTLVQYWKMEISYSFIDINGVKG